MRSCTAFSLPFSIMLKMGPQVGMFDEPARGKQTTNECFAMNIRTTEIIARVNDNRTGRKC